jgi:hypothetical protein
MERVLFGFRLQFLKVIGVTESGLRRDKVLLYAKDFDHNIMNQLLR